MKKVIGILVVAALLMSMMVPVFATDGASTLTVGSATAEVGEEVTLDVTITETTFAAYGLQILYDAEALELVSIVAGAGASMFVPNVNNGKITEFGVMDRTADGVLFTMTFKVLAAGEHTVELDIDSFNKTDSSVVEVTAVAGVISVATAETPATPTLTVGSATAEVGEEVTLDATITETTFAAYGLQILYDAEALELVSIVAGAGASMFVPNVNNGKITEFGVMDRTADGVLFTMTFKVLKAGEHTVELDIDSFNKTDSSVVEVTAVAGTITATGGEPIECEHNYVETARVEATCTEDGYVTYTCDLCGESYTETLTATGHNYTAVVTEPTCTEQGYTTYTCECGDSYVADYVDALGHTYVETERVEATCTEDGHVTYTCECGDSYTEVIEATGHNYVVTETVEATCTEDGHVTYTCECGDSHTEVIEATGHNYVVTETVEATCTEDGHVTYTCECGETYTETVPATGHTFVDGVCTECGEVDPDYVPACEHEFVDGVCTKCGEADPNYNPATGSLNVMALALIAGLSVTAVVVTVKKKEEE